MPYNESFNANTQVTIEAVADGSSEFTNWSSDLSGNQNPTIISISNNKNITVNFQLKTYSVIISKGGDGNGKVKVNNTIQDLPDTQYFNVNTQIELEAIASDSNSEFDNWSGDLNGNQNPITFILGGGKNIIANFKIVTGIENLDYSNIKPREYYLANNYPNPFNPSTVLEFWLPQESRASLKIYDIAGEEVKTVLNNEILLSGKYRYEFSAVNLHSGVYIYVFRSVSLVSNKKFMSVKKMILIK